MSELAEQRERVRAQWESVYGGEGPVWAALREAVISAEVDWLASREAFEQMREELEEIGLPRVEWSEEAWERFERLRTMQAGDQWRMLRAVRALEARAAAGVKQQAASEKQAARMPKPEPQLPAYGVTLEQTIAVTWKDGQPRLEVIHGAEYWLKMQWWDEAPKFKRRFVFEERKVPPELAWVLEHGGVTYEPADEIVIGYPSQEFKRLCEREVREGLGPLDGARVSYYRRNLE